MGHARRERGPEIRSKHGASAQAQDMTWDPTRSARDMAAPETAPATIPIAMLASRLMPMLNNPSYTQRFGQIVHGVGKASI